MSHQTTGTAIVEALAANGVEVVFGIPGTHNLELYRGLAGSALQHVVTRHEQGAAYAADGAARATGRPGVVITTSGPGVTNALTGMANAYADSIPMLVLSPGIPTGLERQDIGWLHEVKDQRGAIDDLVGRSVRPGTPQQTVDAVHETFARWRVERPRPVHIEVPHDVLEAAWDGVVGPAWPVPHRAGAAPEAVAAVVEALSGATRVVVLAGGGAVDAAASVTALAELLDAPVLTTTLGKGVVDEHHPLVVGEFVGDPAVAPHLAAADVVIALGTTLGELPLGDTTVLVRIDLDPAQLHKGMRAAIAIHADVDAAVGSLLIALGPARRRSGGAAQASAMRAAAFDRLAPRAQRWRQLQDELATALPDDVVVTGDSSQVSYLGTGPYWRFRRPRHYLVTTGYSTLGYAVPAAIGAKVAMPDRPVVALVGDGALMFSVQELMTASELGLVLPIVVVDNHGFGEIRENMVDRDIEPMAVTLARPDLVALAESMGCRGIAVGDAAHAAKEASAALDADRPTLVVLEVGAAA